MHNGDRGDDGWGKPDYKVGYGKPPKEHQFKKGQSGNPRGRKPRTTNVTKLLATELDRLISVRDGDGEKRITKREALMTSLVNDAIKGKAAARQLLLKLIYVEPPVDPFVADIEDEAALAAFLKRQMGQSEVDSRKGADDEPA